MEKETVRKTKHSLRPQTSPLERASLVELCKKDLDAATALFTAAQSAINSLRKTDFPADIARKSASPWATVTAALVDWISNMVSYYDLIAVVEERKKLLARQQTSNVS